ncbi:MAG TPA: hypothetical protein VF092_26460 [Longimicrobium sp.]
MKRWLHAHRAELPPDFPPDGTSHQLRGALRRLGWIVREGEEDVRVYRPGDQAAAQAATPLPATTRQKAATALTGERTWVRGLVPQLQAALGEADPALEVREGYRLPYTRQIVSYYGAEPHHQTDMRYETDLLIVERLSGAWIPRVVVEAKLGSVTTHDAITYSQKAATHKHVHPYLRYGIFLGRRAHHPLPGRLFRHGTHFDFMLSWTGLEPSAEEFEQFRTLLLEEVDASRLLQDLMFNTRRRARARFSFLRRPLVVQ